MTNLEYIKNNEETLDDVILYSLAVDNDSGEIAKCATINCGLCLFRSNIMYRDLPCYEAREKWLNEKRQPLYKKGDVVMVDNGHIVLIVNGIEENNNIMVTNNISDLDIHNGYYINVKNIKQKIGSIF